MMPGCAADGGATGTLALGNDAIVPFRPIRPGDAEALQVFHRTLSPESVYQRYFGIVPELSTERANHFAAVDGCDRYALVALDPDFSEAIVGVASFDREGGTRRAECGIAVADDWQRRGVGRGLIRELLRAAARRGVGTAYGYVLPDNRAMLGLLRKVGYASKTGYEGGRVWVELNLADATPDA